MEAWRETELALRRRKAELEQRVRDAERTLDQPGDPDIEDQASGRQGDEVIEGLEEAALKELTQIGRALSRISLGTYGRCVGCGGAIPTARLQAVPHADLCAACA